MTLTVPIYSSIEGCSEQGTCQWTVFPERRTYECRFFVVREACGFSAHALDLPGVVSQGDTVQEAIEHITESFEAVLSDYLESGKIPWSEVVVEGEVECEKRILVNV